MPEAYIVDAVRAPVGRKKGSLAHIHPADLAAHPSRELMARHQFDSALVEDVVWGCTETIGGQAGDIGRTAWLAAGLAEDVPGVTIDRQCGAAQQAVHFAAQGVMSGTQDIVVAGGSQAMNRIPIMAAMTAGAAYGFESPFTGAKGWDARYGDEEVNQIRSAEMIAEKWQISREEMDAFALASHQRAQHATEQGWFKNEIMPLEGLDRDETIRPGTTLEGLASLNPVREGGRVTAGNASQNSDCAAALLIVSEQALKDHGLKPRARIHHMSVRADNPVWMLTGPINATRYAMQKSGMKLSDIDMFECNEAFASVPMAWMKELDIPHEKVNVQGGAIALGHPIGSTGAKLMTTLLHSLERTGGRYGLQTMCEGGGQANVTIIERL